MKKAATFYRLLSIPIAITVAIAASLFLLGSAYAQSGVPDPCKSTAAVIGGPGSFYICPNNDGQTLQDRNLSILVEIRDSNNNPVAGIPAADFWLAGCSDLISFCGGASSSNADATTDAQGRTTISMTTIWGGGGEDLISVYVQGIAIETFDCSSRLCLDISVRSPDINGDLVVNLQDVSFFATGFPAPPLPLEPPFDFDSDGIVGLIDLSIVAQHYLHDCGI